MKKQICMVLCMVFVLTQMTCIFALLPVSAESQGRGYQIYRANHAITVDGVGDDEDWAELEWSEYFVCSSGAGKEDFTARFKATWAPDAADEQVLNLYFLVEVYGDDTISTRKDWAGDVIRFDIDDGSTYFWSGALQIQNTVKDNVSNTTGSFSYGIVDERSQEENKYTVELCHPIEKVDRLLFDIWVQDNTAADLTSTSPRVRYSWNGMVDGGEADPPTGIGRIANEKGEIDMNADVLLNNGDQTIGSLYKEADGTVVLPACEVFGTLIGWKNSAGELYPVGGTYVVNGTEQVVLSAVVLANHIFELKEGASVLMEKPTALRFEAKQDASFETLLGSALQESGAVMVQTDMLTDAILADNGFSPEELDAAQIAYDRIAFDESEESEAYYILKEGITDTSVSYSVCLYVTVKFFDDSVQSIAIANYSAEDHARSVSMVAAAALDDRASVRAEENGIKYQFEIENFSFSPYTKEQNALLEEFQEA